ncbi:hypothetical protein BCR32DRAFT_292705 [Anaeromyces robustus]|uniref:Rhodanese domain-containing protein n=1 Tax=Anaeromyces robustus TaxID=1754192 RepID=A0A1Y1X9E3_9FUNG|nr:hypothetical protein BCR32DRAFT_292705 [Anaeromyces robustus]|eukprot:ORX82391.1 hypothetical protein BCR32DRAFT_292705 [Anaeromyces robustus]
MSNLFLNSQLKQIHENKYKNIKPIIDTGCSKTNYNNYLREKFRDMLIKEHEGFKRIKVKSLILIIEDINSMIEQLNNNDEDDITKEINLDNPILLLDVRNSQDYMQYHIKGAINYPHTYLFRGANQYSNEIIKYKNKNDKLIIVYDENERLAQKVAQGLMERNILNCFMFSGGLIAMLREYPEYIVGKIPETIKEIVTVRKNVNVRNVNLDKKIENDHKILLQSSSLLENNHSNKTSSSINCNNNNSKNNDTNFTTTIIKHNRSPSQVSHTSSISSKSSYTQNSEKRFERITYYHDLKKPQPITDPFDFSVIKKNIPIAIRKNSEENQKKSKLLKKMSSSSPPSLNTNYHALWRIKPKPITEKVTRMNNKR